MRKLNALTIAAAIMGAAAAQAQAPLVVTDTANAGEGSLRAALEAASQSGSASQIVMTVSGDIVIDESLVYTGEAPLEIIGNGQRVRSDANTDLLVSANGGDLAISDLAFEGPGGFSVLNRGDVDGQTAGKGIFLDVREDQTGMVQLALTNVSVKGVANHGIHVSDCTLADDCGSGAGGAGGGSPASLHIQLENVTVDGAGTGKFDADGLRADERGAGDIHLSANGSEFARVGADGLELDEGQAGSIHSTIIRTAFIDNGPYCNPDVLAEYMPAEPEGSFQDGMMQPSDIPSAVTGTPDDNCFEREVSLYDSGSVEEYEIGLDLDDGIDYDEADSGNLNLTMIGSTVSGNYDEGVDMDEAGPGNGNLRYISTVAYGNSDDGFKMSEEDAGGVDGAVMGSVSRDNGGVGVVFEEESDGNLVVQISDVHTVNNDDSDDTGLEIVQEDAGTGELSLTGSQIEDGMEVEGVSVSR
ncbi:hypothetical protein [Spiribacter roseus]|uniref:hypothetical protein n=1 Tax=Spiribacter roseus TaxID=1855875 RepID=UPI001330F4A4|nr:hypothetical protein [Spiribacter roseus]KAF0284128.1 hypothetical protein BA898_07145 [Spiribacter roseus]